MYRLGTANFVSKASAITYYLPYYDHDAEATIEGVNTMLAEGAIHIGPPQLKPGDRLAKGDDDTRYFIETENL